MAKQFKLKLSEMLRAIDNRDFQWLRRQPEDAAKEFSAFRALRMAAGFTRNSEQAAQALWLLNERANVHLFDLSKHPDLLFRLIASCGNGRRDREWMKPLHRSEANKAVDLLREHYPHANHREINVLLSLHTRDSFQMFVADCGKSDGELTEIMRCYDAIQR